MKSANLSPSAASLGVLSVKQSGETNIQITPVGQTAKEVGQVLPLAANEILRYGRFVLLGWRTVCGNVCLGAKRGRSCDDLLE